MTGGRRPDHRHGIHLLVPELSEVPTEQGEFRQLYDAAKTKLRQLNDMQIQELARDLHDEVDRRETDDVFCTGLSVSSTAGSTTAAPASRGTPFLPVDPRFSSIRNQARQKLARLSKRELAALIVDVLSDVGRRQYGSSDIASAATLQRPPNDASKSANTTRRSEQAERGRLAPAAADMSPAKLSSSESSQLTDSSGAARLHGSSIVTPNPKTASGISSTWTADEAEAPNEADYDDVADVANDDNELNGSRTITSHESVGRNGSGPVQPKPPITHRARSSTSSAEHASGPPDLPPKPTVFTAPSALQLVSAIQTMQEDMRKLSEKASVFQF